MNIKKNDKTLQTNELLPEKNNYSKSFFEATILKFYHPHFTAILKYSQ